MSLLRKFFLADEDTGKTANVNSDGQLEVIAKSVEDEIQIRDNLDHKRVYDPVNVLIQKEILAELRLIRQHLEFVTDEEIL